MHQKDKDVVKTLLYSREEIEHPTEGGARPDLVADKETLRGAADDVKQNWEKKKPAKPQLKRVGETFLLGAPCQKEATKVDAPSKTILWE